MFSVRVNLAIALPVGERDRRFNLVSYEVTVQGVLDFYGSRGSACLRNNASSGD